MVFENNVKKQGAQPFLMFLRKKDKLRVLWHSLGCGVYRHYQQ